MIQMQWKKVLVKITLWLATEVILNLLGVDQLVDLSEFVLERKILVASQYVQAMTTAPAHCILQRH